MKHYAQFILTVFFLFGAISKANCQTKAKGDPLAPGENIYKHYTGTIGNRPAAIDIVYGYQGASNFGGSRYYYLDSPGTFLFYIKEPPTFRHDEVFHGTAVPDEDPFTEQNDEREIANSTLEFTMNGKELQGKMYYGSSNELSVIDMKEDYSKAYAFDLLVLWDWIPFTTSGGKKLVADVFSIGIVPGSITNITEMDFLNKQLIAAGPDRSIQAEYITDYYKAYNKNFLKRSYDKMKILAEDGKIDESKTRSAYFSGSVFMLPVYNDNGFVVLKNETESDTSQIKYFSLDVKRVKQLSLKDIFYKYNPRALANLLESELRRKYNLGNVNRLSAWKLADPMPAPGNFMLAHKGIIFMYPAGQLMKEREVRLFLTYDQLWGMLHPNFRERISDK